MDTNIYHYIDLIINLINNNEMNLAQGRQALSGLVPSDNLIEFQAIENVIDLDFFVKQIHLMDSHFI